MGDFTFLGERAAQKQDLEKKRVGLLEQQIQNKQRLDIATLAQKIGKANSEQAAKLIKAADIKKQTDPNSLGRDDPNFINTIKMLMESEVRTYEGAGLPVEPVRQRYEGLLRSPTAQQTQALEAGGAGLKAAATEQAKVDVQGRKLTPTNLLFPGQTESVAGFVDSKSGKFLYRKDGKLIESPEKTQLFGKPQITGTAAEVLTSSQKGKLNLSQAEQFTTIKTNIGSLERIKGFMNSDNYIGGFTGKTVSLVNSSIQQMRQLLKIDPVYKDNQFNEGSVDLDNISEENLSFLRNAAISNDIRESAVGEMAFILARAYNPDGKISDADVRQAKDIILNTADRIGAIRSIDNLQLRLMERYNNTQEGLFRQKIIKKFKPLTVKELIGNPDTATVTNSEVDSVVSQILKNSGL